MRLWFGLLAGLCFGLTALVATGPSMAQQPTELTQIELKESHIKGFIAAHKDLAAIAPKLQAAGDNPDDALKAELEAIAKKNGFASMKELDDVAANISMIMAGLDDQGGFTDQEDTLKKEIAEVQADATIPDAEKKTMLDEMNETLKVTKPLQFKGNIDLVKKYQKEIEQALQ